jgi:radical SAM protein with 4Fe4S-binding SPASM domain
MSERILFINLIKQCNVHCDRCYLTEESRRDPRRLDWNALELVLSSDWANEGDLAMIWEGGEASLAGREHFTSMLERAVAKRPHARQTMVTNLFSLPKWLIELSREHFKSKVETTFALEGKYSLGKDGHQFLRHFAKNYRKAREAGLICPINLELNDHTVALGPQALIDYLKPLGECRIEFDISVDFERFLRDPAYTLHGYPLLPLTTTYARFSAYVAEFWQRLVEQNLDQIITSSLIDEMREARVSSMFAVSRGEDFLTLNPDGHLTTNPLFSDLAPTYLGNVNREPVNQILTGRKRMQFIRHELRKTVDCMKCPYFSLCSGGSPYAPTFDGSGDCSGMKSLRQFFETKP